MRLAPLVLLVAPDDAVRRSLLALADLLHCQIAESTGSTLSRFFEQTHPALVLVGPNVARPFDTLHLARLVQQWSPRVPVALVISRGSEELAIAALRAGVREYFKTPIQPDHLNRSIRRLLGESTQPDGLPERERPAAFHADVLLGVSQAVSSIRTSIMKLAGTESNTLVTGETGTGKELTARLIHASSRRSTRAFVSINCAAIPDALVESELFGYDRGAFTGAAAHNGGRVLAAHRGTAFFDEIGDLSPAAQAKVLRLVEEKELHPLGTTATVRVDTRIVSATNRNLEALIETGAFRSDLYFRLNVARIHLPALRERREDIPLLLMHFLQLIRERHRRRVDTFTPEALEALTWYDWPGNVRELRNLIERLILNASSRVIDVHDLPDEVKRPRPQAGAPGDSERTRLLTALSLAHWNKSAAARTLGWSRMTLYRKLSKHQVEKDRSAVPTITAHTRAHS